MTLFLRNRQNQTIIEVSIYGNDLSAAIVVDNYSRELLASPNKETFIRDFNNLNEIRGWYFEVANPSSNSNKTVKDFIPEIKNWFKDVANRHNLIFRQD